MSSSSNSYNKEYHEPERVLDLYKEHSDNKNSKQGVVIKKKKVKSKITAPTTNQDTDNSNILDELVFEQVPSTPIFHTSKLSEIFISTKANEINSLNQPFKKQKTVFYKSSKLIGTTIKSPEELAIEEEFRKALYMKEQLLNQNNKTNIPSSLLNDKQTNTFVSAGKTVLENKVFKNEKLISIDKNLAKNDEIDKNLAKNDEIDKKKNK